MWVENELDGMTKKEVMVLMMVLSGHLAEVPMENHKKCRTIGVLARQILNVSHSQL
jgi:hypothetical protein